MDNEEEVINTDPMAEEKVLLKEYQKLKDSTVSKEKYEKDLKAAEDKAALYLKAITEGEKVDIPSEEDSGSVVDTINELSNFKGTNLDFWKKTTKAIDQTIKALSNQEIIKMIGSEGLEQLIKVKEGMKQIVDDSHDDSDYFRTLYKSRVQDSAPRISAEIESAGGLVNYLEKQQNNKK